MNLKTTKRNAKSSKSVKKPVIGTEDSKKTKWNAKTSKSVKKPGISKGYSKKTNEFEIVESGIPPECIEIVEMKTLKTADAITKN